ncbi:MAG: nitroreductase family protein [Candidatus Woesearchaeota archaeon]
METLECIESRRSCRLYLDIPVEFEKIGNILNAGRVAPSAGNLQDWRFVLVTEEALRKQLAEAAMKQYWMEKAPVHIVICSVPESDERMYGKRGKELYTIQNCANAALSMLIAAHDQGLGACWVGAFEEGMVRRALQMPDSVRPMAIITIGYPDEEPARTKKNSLEAVVFIERWGNKIKDFAAFVGYYSTHVAKTAKYAKEAIARFLEKWSR